MKLKPALALTFAKLTNESTLKVCLPSRITELISQAVVLHEEDFISLGLAGGSHSGTTTEIGCGEVGSLCARFSLRQITFLIRG